MNQTMKDLRIAAMRERATIYHTMKLSNEDSIGLASEFYRTLTGVIPSFKDFCKTIATRDFRFRGMKIEWFTGDTTRFVLDSDDVEAGDPTGAIDQPCKISVTWDEDVLPDKFSPQEKRNHCDEDE